MGKLRNLFLALDSKTHCRYSTDGKYPEEISGKVEEKNPIELLEIECDSPREYLIMGYFGSNESTGIIYYGEDVNSMKKTLADLRLPNTFPSNLGEKVFYIFRGKIEEIESGPACVEQLVVPDSENKFEDVLKKLIKIYESKDNKT